MVSIATTTQFDFFEGVYDLLIVRPGLANVMIVDAAFDLDRATEPDILMLFGTKQTEDFGSIGNQRKEETYDLQGEIVVFRAGGVLHEDLKACRDRAKAIYAEIEETIRLNKHIANVAWQRTATSAIQQGWNKDGRLVLVPFEIRAFASLPTS